MGGHPNAATAGVATGPAVLIVWLAGRYGIDLGAEQAVVVSGLLTSLVLLIGRRGLRGIVAALWRGGG